MISSNSESDLGVNGDSAVLSLGITWEDGSNGIAEPTGVGREETSAIALFVSIGDITIGEDRAHTGPIGSGVDTSATAARKDQALHISKTLRCKHFHRLNPNPPTHIKPKYRIITHMPRK